MRRHGTPVSTSILDRTDRLLTIRDLATFFNVTPHGLYMQRLRGQPPGSLGFKVGAKVLFDPARVKAWLDDLQAEQARDLER